MPIKYKMSKEMFDNIKYPLVWNRTQKKMVKSKQPLTNKEILAHINNTFGLRGTVIEVNIA